MIVDFRVRPPFGGYLSSIIYSDRARTSRHVQTLGFTPSPSLTDADWLTFQQELEEAGVDVCVVPGRFTTPAYGQIANDDLAALTREHGKRFACFAAVDTASPQAADRVEEAVRELGLVGLTLEPSLYDPPRYLDDPLFEPVCRRCAKLGVPIMVTYGGKAGPDIGYADPVRLERVASSFPNLRIILVHAGWPWVTPTLGVAFRCPNVYLSPDMYIVNMPGFGEYVTAANGFMKERILFASAYPFLPILGAVQFWRSLPFKPDVLTAVMGSNAARILNLG